MTYYKMDLITKCGEVERTDETTVVIGPKQRNPFIHRWEYVHIFCKLLSRVRPTHDVLKNQQIARTNRQSAASPWKR